MGTNERIKIVLNDEELALENERTLDALLKQLDMGQTERIAVAVNDTVVRRADWPSHELSDNDRVLLIAPIQGG